MSKKRSNYIAAFDYFVKTLIVLSETSRGILIISFASIFGAPGGIACVSFSLAFSLTTGIIKKLLKITRNQKKKCNNIAMPARSKLNSIETLISQALIDLEISHEEYESIINEEENYWRLKENAKIIENDDEKDELNEEEGKRIKSNKNIKENNEDL